MRRICCALAALLVLTTLPAWADSVEELLEIQDAVREARDRVLPSLVRIQPISEHYVGGRLASCACCARWM